MPTSRKRARSPILQALFVALAVGILGTIFLLVTHADSTTIVQLHLTPSSKTQAVGTNFTVTVKLEKNDATPVNYVHANLVFPAATLTVKSISTSGGYFNSTSGFLANEAFTKYSNTNGTIDIGAESQLVAQSDDYSVATIVFSTKAAGSALVAFTGKSSVAYSVNNGANTNRLTSALGGSYTVTSIAVPSPAPTPAPTPTPSPNPSPTPNPGPGPSPNPSPSPTPSPSSKTNTTTTTSNTTPDAAAGANATAVVDDSLNTGSFSGAPPTIGKVSITKISSGGATISWQTDIPTTGTIAYGNSQGSLSHSTPQDGLKTKHTVSITKQAARQKIYFEITATSVGGIGTVQDGNFITLGGSKLVSVVVVGGSTLFAVLVFVVGAGFILRNRRQLPASTPKDIDTTNMDQKPSEQAPVSLVTGPPNPAPASPMVPEVTEQPASATPAPELVQPPVPVPVAPAASSVQTNAQIPRLPSRPQVPLARTLPPSPAPTQPVPLAPPVQAPVPTPVPAPSLPPAPQLLPLTPPAPQPAPSTPPSPAQPNVSAQTAEVDAADNVPDMFDEGEQRLEREEQEHRS